MTEISEDERVACALSHQLSPLFALARKAHGASTVDLDRKLEVHRAQVGHLLHPRDMNPPDWKLIRSMLECFLAELQAIVDAGATAEIEADRRRELAHMNARLHPAHRAVYASVQGGFEVDDDQLARQWLADVPAGVEVILGRRNEIVVTGVLPPVMNEAIARFGSAIVSELKRRERQVRVHRVNATEAE